MLVHVLKLSCDKFQFEAINIIQFNALAETRVISLAKHVCVLKELGHVTINKPVISIYRYNLYRCPH